MAVNLSSACIIAAAILSQPCVAVYEVDVRNIPRSTVSAECIYPEIGATAEAEPAVEEEPPPPPPPVEETCPRTCHPKVHLIVDGACFCADFEGGWSRAPEFADDGEAP